jgi:hypothetical protein
MTMSISFQDLAPIYSYLLWPQHPHIHLITATREEGPSVGNLGDSAVVVLEPMDAEAAAQLLRYHLGDKPADDSQVERLVKAVGYNPLVIRVAGGLINKGKMNIEVNGASIIQ